MALTEGDWPGPSTGIAIVASEGSWSGELVPICWFLGYAYAGTDTIAITENPASGSAGWISGVSSTPYDASCLGALGVGADGVACCPGERLDQGEDTDGRDQAVCCIGAECFVVTADVCERLGGDFHAKLTSCDENPCSSGLEGDDGPGTRCVSPLASRVYYADDQRANTFYLDPAEDDALSFDLQTIEPVGSSTTLLVRIYDPLDPVEPIFANLVAFGAQAVTVDGIAWPRTSGLAKVVLTTAAGVGHKYSFSPTEMSPTVYTDREYFNSDLAARTIDACFDLGRKATFSFWVPTMADSMTVKCFTEGSGDWCAETAFLKDPCGQPQFSCPLALPDPGKTYCDTVPEELRGGTWTLEVYPDPDYLMGSGHGLLEVSFKAKDATQWWTPDFAFTSTTETPVRAQFSECDFVQLPGMDEEGNWGYYVPYGSSYDDYEPDMVIDPVEMLLDGGRQRFLFAANPGADRAVTVHNLGDTLRFEWRNSLGSVGLVALTKNEDAQLTVLGGEVLWIRVPSDESRYDIATDAPYAVRGPSPGLTWFKSEPNAELMLSRSIRFFVPYGLSEFDISVESGRACSSTECVRDPYGPDGYINRAYPPIRLVVESPAGNYSFEPEIPDDHGSIHAHFGPSAIPVSCQGHVWTLWVEASASEPHRFSGLGIGLEMDRRIPPYFTWLEKERLFLPSAYLISDQMVHDTAPYSTSWFLTFPAEVYSNYVQTGCRQSDLSEWDFTDLSFSLYQEVFADVNPAGAAHKELQTQSSHMWGPSESGITSVLAPQLQVYAVPRPLGLTAAGDLRTTIGGVPGEPAQFVSMCGITPAEAPPTHSEWAQETAAAGFRKGSVTFLSGNPNPGAWADFIYENYDMLSSIGAPIYFGDVYTPPGWESFRANIQALAGTDPLVYVSPVDEPLQQGIDSGDLREMVYQARLEDDRVPILINDEPTILNMAELHDLAEVYAEDQYHQRVNRLGNYENYPLCDVASAVMKVHSRVREGTATHFYLQGGFYEHRGDGPVCYVSVGPDTAAAEILTCLLLDVDAISAFTKKSGGAPAGEPNDLKTLNPELWDSYDETNAFLQRLTSWMTQHAPSAIDFGPEGEFVQECEFEPVLYGYGYWDENLLTENEIGVWFAFCNLGHEESMTVTIPWGELPMFTGATGHHIEIDGASTRTAGGPPVVTLTPYEQLECVAPPTGWVVGRIVGSVESSTSVTDATFGGGHFSIRPQPSPSSGRVAFEVSLPAPALVEMSVFSLDGRVVWRRDCELEEGSSTVVWDGLATDGARVSPGLYFVRLSEGSSGRHALHKVVVVE
ncbi:MAG: hypothetical protein KAY32_17105 [Candidatus Eisenbacteria sp.]|nr:hypothetical protein [Candidatus Eisenbacteria bacterium]